MTRFASKAISYTLKKAKKWNTGIQIGFKHASGMSCHVIGIAMRDKDGYGFGDIDMEMHIIDNARLR